MGDGTKPDMCFIAGPPFSGKSTVGAILAGRLHMGFENLDEVIERTAGMAVQNIFSSVGEAGFRHLESRCLREIAGTHHPLVVALGGGTLLLSENLETVISRGALFTLVPDTAELLARFKPSGGRPLVPDPVALERLLDTRMQHYASLPGRVDTRGKTPEEVAALIAERLSGFLRTPQ